MSPATPNPKREEMEALMATGVSRDDAYEQVFGVKPENVQAHTPIVAPDRQHSVSSAHFAQQVADTPGSGEGENAPKDEETEETPVP